MADLTVEELEAKSQRAREIHERLGALGHDYSPDKQAYLREVGGEEVVVCHPNGSTRVVPAYQVESLIREGFTFEPPAPEAPAETEANEVVIGQA